jgi:hypothetical protein
MNKTYFQKPIRSYQRVCKFLEPKKDLISLRTTNSLLTKLSYHYFDLKMDVVIHLSILYARY